MRTSLRIPRRCILGVVLLMALPALTTGGQATPAGTTPVFLSIELPGQPAAGARAFRQKGCAGCHSLNGSPEPRVGPDLGRVLFTGTALDLAGAFWNHAPVMHQKMAELQIRPPIMSKSDLADIVGLLTLYRHGRVAPDRSGDPEAGRTLFAARCATCHARDEHAWGKPGPRLERYRGPAAGIFLAQAFWNHRPNPVQPVGGRSGAASAALSEGDAADLIAYLQAGQAERRADPPYFESGSPRRGQALFARKGCLGCHAVAGKGGRGGPDLAIEAGERLGSVPGLTGSMWRHSQTLAADFERRGFSRPTFSGQEMADLTAYLQFVSYATVRGTPGRGRALFAERCSTCHSGDARAVAPDLARVPDLDDPLAIIAAMWNHAAEIQEELQKIGGRWPRLEPGEAADLAAFLMAARGK
jgi:cytochrome c2